MATIARSDRGAIAAAAASPQGTKILAVTAARVYTCGEGDGAWVRRGTGALVLVRAKAEGARGGVIKRLVLRLVPMAGGAFARSPAWEHVVRRPRAVDYRVERPWFHAFEDGGVEVGLMFASAEEAAIFGDVLRKRAKRLNRPSFLARLFGLGSYDTDESDSEPASLESRKPKARETAPPKGPLGDVRNTAQGNAQAAAIDLESVPPEWRDVFARAGVTQAQLQSKDTAAVIASFCAKNSTPAGRPVVPPRRRRSEMPAAPVAAPVPPPKALPKESPVKIPNPPPRAPTPPPASRPEAPRDALLASIRGAGGVSALKHVSPASKSAEDVSAPSTAESSDPQDIMASMLAKALAARNRRVAHSSDDDDE